ncbi:DUF2946 family protein [Lysobacter humi (ex Lee et al. 2017)]
MTMSRRRRRAALLALLAMLLLVVLPAAGRIAQASATNAMASHALHDVDDGMPASHDGADCDYCLVLGGADLPASVASIHHVAAPRAGAVRSAAMPRLAARHRAAGSRGPPAAGRA